MLCAKSVAMSLSIVLAVVLVAPAAAAAEESWKLYDLRDLLGLIPPPAPGRVPAAPPGQAMPMFTQPPAAAFVQESADGVERLMQQLCDAMSVDCTRLLSGVYGVRADEAQHGQLLALLEDVRRLYAERYEVELVWFTTSPDQTPAVGEAVTVTGTFRRHCLVAPRRTPTPLTVVSQHAYLSGLNAVVAEQSQLQEPITDDAEEGLRLSIIVGAGQEGEHSTLMRVSGELRQVTMGKMSGSFVAGVPSDVQIELPSVAVRSIETSVELEYSKLTALCVLDGFADGECVVIAGAVRKLAE